MTRTLALCALSLLCTGCGIWCENRDHGKAAAACLAAAMIAILAAIPR